MTDVGYDAFDDPYCYKGTGAVRNIRHAAQMLKTDSRGGAETRRKK